jgi:hypothetical protein
MNGYSELPLGRQLALGLFLLLLAGQCYAWGYATARGSLALAVLFGLGAIITLAALHFQFYAAYHLGRASAFGEMIDRRKDRGQ